MQTLQAIIMGAVQGLTEFLPVSSSGHIVISSAIYKLITGTDINIVNQEEIFFDILIHLATLFAVVIYFFKDIENILKGFFRAFITKNFNNNDFKLGFYVLIGTFITCLFGFFIKDFAHSLTENPIIVSILVMITGTIIFLSEKICKNNKEITLKSAIITGLFQGFAIFPGLSRSGMTISALMLNGVSRVKAAKFSFILSIPIITLASLFYPLLTFNTSSIKTFNLKAISIGVMVSFVVGYFCIKYFMEFLKKFGLHIFSYYCWAMGLICAIVFTFAQ